MQLAAIFQGLDSKPADLTVMGVQVPLPAPSLKFIKKNNLRCSISVISLRSFLALGGLVHVGCGESCDILQSSIR
jgi:hypothetical protein